MAIALAGLGLGLAVAADDKPYQVAEGSKVDKTTLEGWRTWRAPACERRHGARQGGVVGASPLEALRRVSQDEVKETGLKGGPGEGKPEFDGRKMGVEKIDRLYAYPK